MEARPATYQVEPDFAARQSIVWAIAWLVGAVSISLLLHVLLIRPSFLPESLSMFNYGRLRGIADTAFVFGWLGTIGFAAVYALIPRITDAQLHNEPLGAAATLGWALVLTGGIVALFVFGVNQGRPLGELGSVADLAMVFLLVVVLYNATLTVVRRREKTLYASGWFLLAAVLLAPLVFMVGNLPLFNGIADSIASGYYLNGIEMLWFLPIALGIAHYVVPVETGSALYSGALARTAFWSLVFAGGWTGQRFFLKNPAPDYLDTIAVAMTAVLLIPALSAAVNLFATGGDRWQLVSRSYGLRFAAVGLGLLVAWIVLVIITTVPSVYRFVGVTSWQAGVRHLAFFGVFSSFAFALIYHAYPLMVGRDWWSRQLASFHFWATTIGTVVLTALYLAIGSVQGSMERAGNGPIGWTEDITSLLRILVGLVFVIVAVAQYAFALNTFKTSRSGPFVHVSAQPVFEATR